MDYVLSASNSLWQLHSLKILKHLFHFTAASHCAKFLFPCRNALHPARGAFPLFLPLLLSSRSVFFKLCASICVLHISCKVGREKLSGFLHVYYKFLVRFKYRNTKQKHLGKEAHLPGRQTPQWDGNATSALCGLDENKTGMGTDLRLTQQCLELPQHAGFLLSFQTQVQRTGLIVTLNRFHIVTVDF